MKELRTTDPRVDEWLVALEDVPPAEREAWLNRTCPDPELRREVLDLLAAETESRGYLRGLADSIVPKLEDTPDLAGRHVGAYQLVRPIGRGGMGVVYEARRADGAFEQRVALKLLTTALVDTGARQHFLTERQILANLEHRAIARILDGGVTDDGTPWFAMEYVEGIPIDAYCDRHQLGIRERLELFLQVCDAVEHAHRRLVVHRDLKPGNVLVSDHEPPSLAKGAASEASGGCAPSGAKDGAGKPRSRSASPRLTPFADPLHTCEGGKTVKLLDFGIAKLLDPNTGDAPATRTALRMMTPEYASPEQTRGETITIASDVYQLGLLLYELLAGRRPYALQHGTASELEYAICEQPPTRLSAAVTRGDSIVGGPSGPISKDRNRAKLEKIGPEGPPTDPSKRTGGDVISALCRLRRTTPAKLRRRLRGDLENIVGKALSKEPDRRYGSADRLAQDLRHHLTGLPVTARQDTVFYRARKFFQRHAVGAAASAAALLLAAGMTGLYLTRIQSERDVAQLERDRAEAEAARAHQVSDFLAGIFQSASPMETGGAELSARELLDRGVSEMDRELAGQPETQAQMLHVLGTSYTELGVYDSAEALLLRALELRRSRLGPEHPEFARTASRLGRLWILQGKHEQARELLEEAAQSLEASPGDHAHELVDTMIYLGDAHRRLGGLDEARHAFQRAQTVQNRWAAGDAVLAARVLNGLGALASETGDYEQAEDYFGRSAALHERVFGKDHPRLTNPLMNLAIVRAYQGKLDGIEALFRRGVAIQEKAYGERHRQTGFALQNLGHFLTVTGQYEDAVEVLQQALEVHNAALGPDHPDVALPLGSLGLAHLAAGRLREAREYQRRSVTVRAEALGEDRPDRILFGALVGLGHVEAELGDMDASERSLLRALSLWRQDPESMDSRVTPTLLYLGHWLVETGRCEEAIPLLRQVAELPPPNPHPLSSRIEAPETLLAACHGSPQPISERSETHPNH